jgi:hypothetical protein
VAETTPIRKMVRVDARTRILGKMALLVNATQEVVKRRKISKSA